MTRSIQKTFTIQNFQYILFYLIFLTSKTHHSISSRDTVLSSTVTDNEIKITLTQYILIVELNQCCTILKFIEKVFLPASVLDAIRYLFIPDIFFENCVLYTHLYCIYFILLCLLRAKTSDFIIDSLHVRYIFFYFRKSFQIDEK